MKSIVIDGQLSLFDEHPKVINIINTKKKIRTIKYLKILLKSTEIHVPG
ncbi:hypothetical protein [Clostridium butyricum]